MWIRMTMASALALALSACATAPTRVAFAPGAAQKLGEVTVLDLVAQDEVLVRAPSGQAAAAGGGLLGALIESKMGESQQNKIDAAMAPLYASADDLDFRARLAAALGTALGAGAAVKFGTVEHAGRPMAPADLDARRATLDKDGRGLMLVTTSYTLTPDYRVLNVVTSADMRKSGKDQPQFLNTYTYQSQPVGGGGAASVTAWAANGGAHYRSTLDQAAQQVAAMMRIDLAPAPAEAGAPRVTLARNDGAATKQVSGPQLDGGAGRAIVRDSDGRLYSLPQANGGQP